MADEETETEESSEPVEEQEERVERADEGGVMTLGLERWVQFAFVLLAFVVFFLSDKLITLIWGYFAEPDGTIVSGAAAIVGIVTGYVCYRHPTLSPRAHDVATELSKVTWPKRTETWSNTVVVIVTSIIAALYLGAFDFAWGAFTDLLYATPTVGN